MAFLNGLQSKRKTKEDQGEEFGEWKTSIVHCHTMLLVQCMTAHMTTAISHLALKAETNCKKALAWFSNIKALLGNDKILIRAGKNKEKILSKLFLIGLF